MSECIRRRIGSFAGMLTNIDDGHCRGGGAPSSNVASFLGKISTFYESVKADTQCSFSPRAHNDIRRNL